MPADAPAILWNEGEFALSGQVQWSYRHTHEAWGEGVQVWVGADAERFGMRGFAGLGNSAEGKARYASVSHDQTRGWMASRARQVDAFKACEWLRADWPYEVLDGDEHGLSPNVLDGRFDRKALGMCARLRHVLAKQPWVSITYLSPASPASVMPTADMHMWIYIFVASNRSAEG